VHLIISQLRQPGLIFVLRLAAMADFGFQPGYFGIGLEQRALSAMYAVAGGEMASRASSSRASVRASAAFVLPDR
jgi:hypothetical protein